jgi:ABC-type branched-subunit amino acid transport system substrate-binding protein
LTYRGTECEHPQVTSQRSRRARARALVAAAAVLAVSATAACSSSAQSGAVQHSTLTVVSFNPFTGPDGSFGPEMQAGCLAAATAVNAAGGVLSNKVACSAVDTRGDPADAVTGAAKMLATTSHLFGVLGPSSDEADSTAPLINAAKIPMFADTGEASFDQTKLQYFWRMTPADDVQGYAMALYAKQKGYLRAAAVFGNDISSQGSVPTLVKAYTALGGQMVLNEKIALNQASYQPEVEQIIAAKPQVIFTETSPQTNATYLAELQQQGHLIPVIGTDVTIQPTWFSAMAGSIGKSALTQYFVAEQPYAPSSGAGWQVFNKNLLALRSVPKPAQWSTDSYTMTDYDSVVVMALAATAAKSTSPAVWNAYIRAVTTASPGTVVVHSYADGVAALKAGKKIDYVGATGIIAWDKWHNSTGEFEVQGWQPNGSTPELGLITAADIAPLLK